MPTRGRDPRHANALTNFYRGVQRLLTLGLNGQFQSRAPRGCFAKTSESFNHTNHLMPQNYRQMRRGSPPFDLVQLRVADSASRHAQQDFAWSESRLGVLDQLEGRVRRLYIPKRVK